MSEIKFPVSEIFYSVEGEGARTGAPAIFIRLFGCNLACHYCFGIKPGRHKPKLRLGYTHNSGLSTNLVSLDAVRKGDWIMTFDDHQNLVETQITELTTREVRSWYELVIDGLRYYVTGDHPIFTIHGLQRVDQLSVGDYIIEVKSPELLRYRALHKNCMKDPSVVKKRLSHVDYDKVGEQVGVTRRNIFAEIRRALAEGVPMRLWSDKAIQYYHSYMTGMKAEVRKKLSLSHKGDKNPMWKPNAVHTPNYNFLRDLIASGKITHSQLSGKTLVEDDAKCFHVHHIDGNHENDDWGNLIVVTSREHNQIHQRGYNFGKATRPNGKQLSVLFAHNGKQITEISKVSLDDDTPDNNSKPRSPLMVYTLSCSPYNTYLIDNMWVHNCDSVYACKQTDVVEPFKTMTIDEIVLAAETFAPCKCITLTGGEPLIHKNAAKLVDKLRDAGFWVNIETNGSIDLAEFKSRLSEPAKKSSMDYFFTMDWKSISSGEAPMMLTSNLELLDTNDVLKFVVGSEEDLDQMRELLEHNPDIDAQIYVSPVWGKIEPSRIVAYILENRLTYVKVQVQLHKIIWDPVARGV